MLTLTSNLDTFLEDDCCQAYSDLTEPRNYNLIFSGSFNPLHQGHLAIAHHAENLLQLTTLFEICICRYDKVVYNKEDILRIKAQFDSLNRRVMFTRLPSFLQKTLWFENRKQQKIFLIGQDTLQRLADSQYFFGSYEEKLKVYSQLQYHNAKFLVYPRETEKKVIVDGGLQQLCTHIKDFKPIDISSTQLRKDVIDTKKQYYMLSNLSTGQKFDMDDTHYGPFMLVSSHPGVSKDVRKYLYVSLKLHRIFGSDEDLTVTLVN